MCFQPAGLPGGEYEQFPPGSESYGTFQGDHLLTDSCQQALAARAGTFRLPSVTAFLNCPLQLPSMHVRLLELPHTVFFYQMPSGAAF